MQGKNMNEETRPCRWNPDLEQGTPFGEASPSSRGDSRGSLHIWR